MCGTCSKSRLTAEPLMSRACCDAKNRELPGRLYCGAVRLTMDDFCSVLHLKRETLAQTRSRTTLR